MLGGVDAQGIVGRFADPGDPGVCGGRVGAAGGAAAWDWGIDSNRLGRALAAHRQRRGDIAEGSVPLAAQAWLLALIVEQPDMTLAEIADRLRRERDLGTALSSWCRFFGWHGISFKKKCAPPSSSGRTWPRRASYRNSGSPGLIRHGWFSSTRPAPPPTWPASAGGPGEADGWSAGCRMAIGRPPLFWPACAAMR